MGGGGAEEEQRHWYTDRGLSGKLPVMWPGARQTRSHALFFSFDLRSLFTITCTHISSLKSCLCPFSLPLTVNPSLCKTMGWNNPVLFLHEAAEKRKSQHERKTGGSKGKRRWADKKRARSYKLGHVWFSLIGTFKGKMFSVLLFAFLPGNDSKD